MRYKSRPKKISDDPDPWSYREVAGFLYLPKILRGSDRIEEVRWLEGATRLQRYWWDYQLGGEWVDIEWINHEQMRSM